MGPSRRLPAALVAFTLGIMLSIGAFVGPAAAATPATDADSGFLSLLNGLRTTLVLPALVLDSQLSSVAMAWSVNMANTGTLAHNPDMPSQVTSPWSKLGENVGTGDAVTQIFNALVASPPHMRNMADPDFSRIGIGSVTDASGRLWTTHVFMRPKAAGSVAPVIAPTTTKAPTPPTTRALAPRPAPTPTVAPTTVLAPPPTAAPVPTTVVEPVPTTVAAPPVEAAGVADPIDAAPILSVITPVSSDSPRGQPASLLVGAAVFGLLVLGGTGFLLRRAIAPGGNRSSR